MNNPSLINSPDLDSWITFDSEGTVHVRSGKVDIGQRISTALSVLVGEELEIDPARIVIEPPDTAYPNEGMTSGSNSMMHSGHAVRTAAATARRHLLEKAAKKLEVEVDALVMEEGLISVRDTNQSVAYHEVLDNGSFGIAVDPKVTLKVPAKYRWIGKESEPRALRDMVMGAMTYLHDIVLPGMRHARCVRPPNMRARLVSIGADVVARLEVEGIMLIRDGSFVAVVGDDEYPVVRAAERLARAATWESSRINSVDLYGQMTSNACESHPVVDGTPLDAPVTPLQEPPADALLTLAARYDKPYIMHGSIGPSAAAAEADGLGGLKIWTHSQGIQFLKTSISEALGVSLECLVIQHIPGAGCYGHNGADDAAFEAALLALALPGRPVLLKWSRDDEHAWEPYGSAMSMELRASLDTYGKVIDWSHESYSDTHLGRPRPKVGVEGASRVLAALLRENPTPPFRPKPSMVNQAGLHRNIDPYYSFPAVRAVKNLVRDLPLRTSALRCLGGFANIFALESMMDELAYQIGADPVAFRLRHLADPRARDVIEAAADGIDWSRDRDHGVGRGIAFSRYCNSKTYAAIAIELKVNDAAEIDILKAVCAADSGEVADAAGLRMQLEGGVLQAISWTVYEEVLFDQDGITSRDWETYPILNFAQAPPVDVIILDRPGTPPLGAGEASSEPVAAAIANALFDAAGVRARRLPMTPENLRKAAADADG